MSSAPALATAADAAHWAGCSVGTIWRWASEGRIAVYGRGKRVRYDLMEIPAARRDPDDGHVLGPVVPPAVTGRRRLPLPTT